MARPSTSPGSPRRRGRLTRDRILVEALALIDESGLDALSMRTLGARLDVEAMALYRHVAGKRGLLEGVADVLLAEMSAGPAPEGGWRELLVAFARRYRGLVLAHPEAAPLLSGRPGRSYVAARDVTEALLEALAAGGFAPDDAVRAVRLVSRYVVGFSLDERRGVTATGEEGDGRSALLADGDHPLLRALLGDLARPGRGDEELFEFGLAVLLDGLERRLGGRSG